MTVSLRERQALAQAGGREGGAEAFAALREVGPAVEMDRDDRASAEDPRRLDRPLVGERQVGTVEALRDAGAADEQHGKLDRAEAFGDRANDLDGGVVAAHVERRQVVGGEHEADHRTGEVIGAVGPVPGGNRGDRQPAAARALQLERAPRLEPDGVAVEAPGARDRGQDPPRPGQERTPGGVGLSAWWSCESSTASISPTSSAPTAGPRSSTSPRGCSPGGSKVGSVTSRRPPNSSTAVGPPTTSAQRAGPAGMPVVCPTRSAVRLLAPVLGCEHEVARLPETERPVLAPVLGRHDREVLRA
jgi:hypothetical protein